MTLAIALLFGLAFCSVAVWANSRFQAQERLPMQWWLTGAVTWSAPRRLALAFIPAISIVMLVGFAVLLSRAGPRPGQEGMVVPSLLALGATFLAAQLFHLWMVDRTIRRNDG